MERESSELDTTFTSARDARIGERIAERCLSLMLREFARAPFPVLCADAFLTYLAIKQTGANWPFLWFAASALLQGYRYGRARQLRATPPASAAATLRRLCGIFAIIGVSKASLLPVFFVPGAGVAPFLVTMVITGLAAGGVASAAGVVLALLSWGIPIFGVLLIGWLIQGGVAGIAVAMLLALLFAILLAYVRDQRRMIEELVRLVDDKEILSVSFERERDRAEAASSAKTRFFAAASHDLRQPLHALSINATTLALISRRSGDRLLQDTSRGIDSALGQSQTLLDGLLDISRLDARAVKPEKSTVNLARLLGAVRDQYAGLASQKGLAFDLELADDARWTLTDPDQILRVIGNLVNNALKFTVQGRVSIQTARMADDRVAIRIRDSGPGIALNEQSKVFEEFYQGAVPAHHRAEGLGLGLSIVKRTCDLLEAEITMTSEPGVGTVFEVRLEGCQSPTVLESPSVAAKPDEPAPAGVYSVLIVDDEPEIIASLCRYLAEIGWAVASASGGDEASALLADGLCVDALVVDYRLAGETGLDVIERLAKLCPGIPSIVVTGDTSPQRLRELASSASIVLHKPLDGARLAAAIRRSITEASLEDKA